MACFISKADDWVGIYTQSQLYIQTLELWLIGGDVSPYITEVPAFHLQALYIALGFGAIQRSLK